MNIILRDDVLFSAISQLSGHQQINSADNLRVNHIHPSAQQKEMFA